MAFVGGATLAVDLAPPERLSQAIGIFGLTLLGAGFGAAHGLFYPSTNALAVEGAGEHERGKVMALFQGSFNAGFASGTLALGFLADAAGYPAVFVAAGGFTLLALVALAAPLREGSSG